MNKRIFLSITISIIFCSICCCQNNDSLVNYLDLPRKIIFENKTYTLVSTSHSTKNHYKQDYAIIDDTALKLTTAIYFEVVIDTTNIATVVNKKMASMEKLKDKNHIVVYHAYTKEDAVLLHFMISELYPDRHLAISSGRFVNIFRRLKNELTGEVGIIVFGFTAKSKEVNLDDPDAPINAMRKFILKDVADFEIPKMTINK